MCAAVSQIRRQRVRCSWALVLGLVLASSCGPSVTSDDEQTPPRPGYVARKMAPPDLPWSQEALEAAAIEDGILVFCPETRGGFPGRLLSWRFGEDSWTESVAPQPFGAFAASGRIQDEVVICGGLIEKGKVSTASVLALRPTRGELQHRVLPSLPRPRNRHAAVVVGGDLHVLGGMIEVSSNADDASKKALENTASMVVWRAGQERWQELAPMPTARHGHCAVAVGHEIFAIGGDAGYPTGFAPLEIYNTKTGQWRPGAPLPAYRIFSEAAVWERAIYVFGNRSLELFPVLRYSIDSDSWQELSTRRFARNRTAIAVHGSRVYLLGGEMNINQTGDVTNHVAIFDMKTESWLRRP